MDVHSNLERNWRQFPLLAKIITEQGRIPDRLYRGGASYHTILDDFHDWMLMGSQVVEPDSCQPDMSYVESPKDIDKLHHDIHHEFTQLRSRMRSINQFLGDLQESLQEAESRVHHVLERWRQQEQAETQQPPLADLAAESSVT